MVRNNCNKCKKERAICSILPREYNDGLFLRFLKGVNKHSEKTNKVATENINDSLQPKEEVKKKNSIDIMREDNKTYREKEYVLFKIEENPELINNWSTEKLKKLEKIYDEKIAEYDIEIARLKRQNT